MYKQILPQPNIQGIAAGAVATGNIPTSGTHYGTFFRCLTGAGVALTRAQIIADIGDIKVRINGEIVVDATATFLLDLQKYYGDTNVAAIAGNLDGIIPIFWTRPYFSTDSERSIFALGMENVSSFQIDVQVVGVAQLSTIAVYSLVTPERRNLGQHIRINRFPQNFATTGVHEIVSLPKEGDDVAYTALHICGQAAGSVSQTTVKIGGNNIYENVPGNLAQVISGPAGRAPQATYHHIDFSVSNDLTGFIPMAGVKDWRQQITWITNAPVAYNIYTERIFGLKVAK